MKIVYVTSTLPHGTGEPFVIAEIAELRRRGHDVLLVPMNPRGGMVHDDAETLRQMSVSRAVFSVGVIAAAAATAARMPVQTLRAASVILGSRSAVILAKNVAALPKGLWLACVAKRWGADHIHAHWAGCTSTMALIAAQLTSIPWSVTTHRWDIGENNLLRIKARAARFVRAINQNGADALKKVVADSSFEPVIIHMGVPLPEDPGEPPIIVGRQRGLMAASLVEVKGHIYLLQAIANLKNRGVPVCIDLVGSGPLRPALERMTRELGISDCVRFLGQLSHGKLLERIHGGEWSFVVLSSIVTKDGDHEGTPVILMEAMSFGVPVIATSTGGIPELVRDGAGLLVPQKDPESLANAIQRLISEADLTQNLSCAGRRRVEESFSITTVVDALERQFLACH
jgi:colanic acid/amylovoran biosynthesis glycosyltransferase